MPSENIAKVLGSSRRDAKNGVNLSRWVFDKCTYQGMVYVGSRKQDLMQGSYRSLAFEKVDLAALVMRDPHVYMRRVTNLLARCRESSPMRS